MLASFSSFIPTGLSGDSKFRLSSLIPGNQQPPATANANVEIEIEDDAKSIATQADDTALVKKSKDKKQNANETFIFVRPPPAVNNHPLNLQVQLVPPNSRAPTGIASVTGSLNSRRSMEITNQPLSQSPPATADSAMSFASQQHGSEFTGGEPLDRTTSNRSTYSSYSATTSSASISTVNSTTSTRRAIIPLYNLQAHNVMANVIVDAGTDAKIVKFTKRGMEMISLAVLEPIEVWGAPQQGGSVLSTNGTNAMDGRLSSENSRLLSPNPSQQANTPGSSHLSLSSAGAEPQSPEIQPKAPSTPTQNQPQRKRDIFGKIFKRKDGGKDNTPPTTPTPKGVPNSPYGHVRTPSTPTSTAGKRSSLLVPPSPGPSASSTSLSTPPPQTATPTLGITPQLTLAPPFSMGAPRTGRPTLYVWVVKKWLKGEYGSSLLNPKRAMMSPLPDPTQSVEVRFEWRRGKTGRKKKNVTATRPVPVPQSSGDSKEEMTKEEKRRRRLSTQSAASVSVTNEDHSAKSSPSPKQRQLTLSPDDGEDSDPEDSETPWSCTLKIRSPRRQPSSSPVPSQAEGNGADGPLKVKLGTLSPTPHHPKVVAMLKVPFPLPDVGVDSRAVRSRSSQAGRRDRSQSRSRTGVEDVFGDGGAQDAVDDRYQDGGLVLTAEEIKDVVCATGLWLVVREGFGGVGKVNRKGDGWRIRA